MNIENTQAAGLLALISSLPTPSKECDKEVREKHVSVIDRCTVWTERLHNDGRRYATRYLAYDKDMLINYAKVKQTAIDMTRSPSLSAPELQPDGRWAINLTYYGLD